MLTAADVWNQTMGRCSTVMCTKRRRVLFTRRDHTDIPDVHHRRNPTLASRLGGEERKRRKGVSLLPPAHVSWLFYHQQPPKNPHTNTHLLFVGSVCRPPSLCSGEEKEASDSGTPSYCAFLSSTFNLLLLPSSLTHTDPQSYYPRSKPGLGAKKPPLPQSSPLIA